MQDAPDLAAGIAVVDSDCTSVDAGSNSRTGAFWNIHGGRGIGVLTA